MLKCIRNMIIELDKYILNISKRNGEGKGEREREREKRNQNG